MKLRLNKATLAQMPEQVRQIVEDWKRTSRKAFISVETRPTFWAQEDAKVTLINLLTEKQQTERVAGDWAGYTRFAPNSQVPLPAGVVAVVTGIFLGHHWLTIYQGQDTTTQIGTNEQQAYESAEEFRMAAALR